MEQKSGITLRAIKAAHTAIWAFFVVMIGAVWLFALQGNLRGAAWAIGIVSIEVAVLGCNQGRCPLGRVVGRFTQDRSANFDIYLPAWLAARTKPIFGSLFVGGIILTAWRWAAMPGADH